MKRLITGIFLLALVPGLALGQSSDRRSGWGYGYGGVGGTTGDFSDSFYNFGGGGEALIYKGFGVGADLGYVAPTGGISEGVGAFSVNGAYHFGGRNPDRKVVPFVTGGYSLLFREGAVSGGNIGGGVQYWASDRLGMRFEVRNIIVSSDSPHFVGLRVGLTFR
jgi:hypothetical protein